VSRELVAPAKGSLQKLCEQRIDERGRLAVLMIDGKYLYGECVVVALGVDFEGNERILGLVQGATENSTVVQHLLDDLIERGLDATQRMLIVLDGSKALRKAIRKTFGDQSPVQRCQFAQASQCEGAFAAGGSTQRRSTHPHGLCDEGPRAGQGSVGENGGEDSRRR
jgi:hypothetical protein